MKQFVVVLSALVLGTVLAFAGEKPGRILSLNMCTDQLLLDLAEPDQIAGLSPYAADARRSYFAARARLHPVLLGTAEEVMVRRPDLVVASRFGRQETLALIEGRQIAVERFEVALTVAQTRQQILRFGEITGNGEKARARVAEIDAALSRLRASASTIRLRILPLSRRAWVSGRESLLSDMLAQAGLANAAGELGFRHGGFASLEAIVRLKPDAILLAREPLGPEDQGEAMLVHPVLAHLFPPERRLVIPESLTVCGGPMVVDAMDRLAKQLRALKPR